MGLLDLFRGRFVDPTWAGVHAGGDIITTRLDAVVKWGRKSSVWPMPFGTACCAIEFMAFTASHYDVARFGSEVLRFSPRQADLMFVAGTMNLFWMALIALFTLVEKQARGALTTRIAGAVLLVWSAALLVIFAGPA